MKLLKLACKNKDFFFSKPRYTKFFINIPDISFEDLATTFNDLIF